MISLEPMQFVTNIYSGTGVVEPASLGNHLPVALDWSKHQYTQGQRKLLRMKVRAVWIMAYQRRHFCGRVYVAHGLAPD